MAAVAMSPPDEMEVDTEPKPTLTPPASEEADKQYDSGSELSELDLEMEDDKPETNNDEIVPDHYYDGGKIPVFKPVRRHTAPILAGHGVASALNVLCSSVLAKLIRGCDDRRWTNSEASSRSFIR